MLRRHVMLATAFVSFAVTPVDAQLTAPSQETRLSVAAAPLLTRPRGDFRRNVGNGIGGGGGLLYHLDRPGFFSLRFDVSGLEYGRESKRVPFSPLIGGRVLVDATTTNSIIAVSLGPEVTLPRGPVRPYANAAFSGLFFRTSSSVDGIESSEGEIASTTNYSDATRAWVFGSGVRIPLPGKASRVSLDFGLRYHRGGQASYLREGSIRDNPDGSISFTPLRSRTPYIGYLIGIQFRIPYNSPSPCPRFLC